MFLFFPNQILCVQTPKSLKDYSLNFPSDSLSNTYLDSSETHPSKDWFDSVVFCLVY